MPEARRTLVKSPPELWAEISDADCLAKHLEPFGEIRITRTDPETTVAWEGDRARGTVELAASGWGTKVRLTAEPLEVEADEEPAAEEPVVEAPVAEAEPEAVEPEAEAAPPPKRPGFFARLFRRRKAEAEAAPPEEPAVDEPVSEEPVAEEPPAPIAEPEVAAEAIRVSRMADEEAAAVLDGVLDTLGAAHHRPFSR